MRAINNDIVILLLGLALLLFFARLFGEILRKFGQPIVIGEIIAGIVLGPTLLGSIFPEYYDYLFVESENVVVILEAITTLAVVMLMLTSGLEVDLGVVFKQGKPAFLTSLMGIIFPFLIGFAVAYYLPEFVGAAEHRANFILALFIGTALSITALPVVARTLMDLNIFKSEIGYLIISSAMINDVIGWIIFSMILGLLDNNTSTVNLSYTVMITLLFFVLMILIGRKTFNKAIEVIYKKTVRPGGILNFILILGFLGAAFTEYIGIHAIFGSFVVGMAIGGSVHLKVETKEILNQFITNIFAPLFFVSIGLHINFIENFDLLIVLVFLLLAFAGKVIGCSLGAYWGGFNKDDSLQVGFGMNSRGAMEIVLGILALQADLINEKIFVAIVIMALVTSITSAPLMNIFIKRSSRNKTFGYLFSENDVFYTSAVDSKSVIRELAERISTKLDYGAGDIFNEVWKREMINQTGIQNYLAIPHAFINIKIPAIAIAISRGGIDFSASDDLPSKIIVMLLTPTGKNELQLKLLVDIVNKFVDPVKVKQLLSSESEVEFTERLKSM